MYSGAVSNQRIPAARHACTVADACSWVVRAPYVSPGAANCAPWITSSALRRRPGTYFSLTGRSDQYSALNNPNAKFRDHATVPHAFRGVVARERERERERESHWLESVGTYQRQLRCRRTASSTGTCNDRSSAGQTIVQCSTEEVGGHASNPAI